MIEFNKLTFNNKSTADFDFEIIVETSPSLNYVSSKSELFELDGKTGALVRDNSNRGVLPLKYTLHLIKPTDEQLKEIKRWLSAENVWLKPPQKNILYKVYKVESFSSFRNKLGNYQIEVEFKCDPIAYNIEPFSKVFNPNGTLDTQGDYAIFPKITIEGNSASEVSLTIGTQVVRFSKLDTKIIMDGNPSNPVVLDKNANDETVLWKGDFIKLEPNKRLGIVGSTGITSIKIECRWGWY